MAPVLSFFIPGLGQLIQGRVFTALLCFILTVLGYICFIIPGIIMHILVICDAHSYSRRQMIKDMQRVFNTRRV